MPQDTQPILVGRAANTAMYSKAALHTYMGKKSIGTTSMDTCSHQGATLVYMPRLLLTTAIALFLRRLPEGSLSTSYQDSHFAVNNTISM
jgi:hypothetical protein